MKTQDPRAIAISAIPHRRSVRQHNAAVRELFKLLFLFTGALGTGYLLVWRPLLERLGM